MNLREVIFVSNKDKIIQLLDVVPEYKIGYILAYIQGITADDEADNLFCRKLADEYADDPDPEKDIEYSLEDCKKEWGL